MYLQFTFHVQGVITKFNVQQNIKSSLQKLNNSTMHSLKLNENSPSSSTASYDIVNKFPHRK